jgi:V/A-type H+-transporting ATPase subunit E
MSDAETRRKLEAMREYILDTAGYEARSIVEDAQKKAQEWRTEEAERLEREAELILRNARLRAEEIRLRQTSAAERERSRQAMRYRNKLIHDAARMLADRLRDLRNREDYPAVLRGLLAESMEAMGGINEVRILLAEKDIHLGKDLVEYARKAWPGVKFTVGPEPAPISGGLWLISGDGSRRVNADWDAKVQDLLPVLAERLGQVL